MIRMTKSQRTTPTIFVVVLLLAGALRAEGEGRLMGTVLDPAGQPLAGATVAVTKPQSDFRLEKKTDGKGGFNLLVLDATPAYLLRVEKEGFQTLEQPLQLTPDETLRLTLTLAPVPPPEAPAPEVPPPPDPEAEALAVKNQAIGAYNDGVIRLQLNDVDGALAKFAEAATLDPTLAEAQAAVADLYAEKGKHAEALAAADRYLELRPEDRARVAATRYDAAEALGNQAVAEAALEELIQLRPGRDTAVRLFNKGVGLLKANQAAAAVAVLNRALEVDATLAKSHYLLGVAHAQAGDKAAARTHLEKFLELAPQDADAAAAKKLLTSLSGG